MAEWLIIALVLVVAFGGVAYVLPSKLQRRVARVRLEARKQGMHTSAVTMPDLDAEAPDRVTSGGKVKLKEHLCVAYDLNYSAGVSNPPIWQLERYSKSQLPIPGWLLRDQRHEGVDLTDVTYWSSVVASIAEMPRFCRSVVSHEHGVRWVGIETKEEVLADDFLEKMAGALTTLRDVNATKQTSNDETNESE